MVLLTKAVSLWQECCLVKVSAHPLYPPITRVKEARNGNRNVRKVFNDDA